MAEKKKKKEELEEQTAAAAEGTESSEPTEESAPSKGHRLNPITLGIGGILAFVVFLGAFSYMMGVFDPPPPPTQPSSSEMTGADAKSDSTHQSADKHDADGEAFAGDQYGELTDNPFAVSDSEDELERLSKEKAEISKERSQLSAERMRLESLKREVEQLLTRKSQAEIERINYLAKLVDGMKHEEAAALMANWDDETIVTVLPRMKITNASKILATMKPERAATITRMMLSLSTSVPTQDKES